MKCGKWGLSIVLILVIVFTSINITAYASELRAEDEAETEQQKEEEAKNAAYEMEIQTNKLKNWPQGPGTFGEAAIVMEVGTGAVLYAKNIDTHQYPASITKVLTALLAFENGQLQDRVVLSHDSVAFLQPGDSSIGLKEGNNISLEQALYATLLASANEAAYAVGENVGINAGHDYNWFIEQMNARCKELGGNNSNFVNTNGLHDENHYTCARDTALIGRELFKHPEFFQIVQTLDYSIPASETCEEHIFQQKDKMLRPENSNYYECVIGGKTGFTSDALSTLITMADNGQMQLVCVVLRTHGPNIYPDTRNLLDYAFANFSKADVAEAEKSKDISEILSGDETDACGYVMLPNGAKFKDLDMELTPDNGQSNQATLTYSYGGNMVGTAKATLSDSYIAEHSAKVKDTVDKAVENSGKNVDKSDKMKNIIIGVSFVILIILIAVFILLWIKQKRKRRRRR